MEIEKLNEQSKSHHTRIQWQRKLRWLPAIIWMAVIFYLSAQTGDDLGAVLPFFQKYLPFMEDFNWGHYVSYFILAMTIDYGFGAKSRMWKYKLLIVLLCGLYGVTDEFHQYFVGGRMTDIYDLRNDCIGAACWVLLERIPFIRALWKKLSFAA